MLLPLTEAQASKREAENKAISIQNEVNEVAQKMRTTRENLAKLWS